MNIEELNFDKGDGLIPAIIQDEKTGRVLMLGYMNREAVEKTLKSGLVTFYSRSKKRLWTKGETSGNYLHLREIQKDCDDDTILVQAEPEGPTCHTGHDSCFHEKQFSPSWQATSNGKAFLDELEDLLYNRKKNLPEKSYTSTMFKKGLDRIAQKVGEEGVETVIAAKNDDKAAFIYEASDLVF
ncbi:MAG TPA: bifunctional phosphoribosyl-AMP cyclohydrolase/phosphoribosyl-ATP diphosphatase HisIE, partial [Balneolales bacterium]|nr:bifunctional phosphoribosyl-AMP cyclohydrolase/phosphoribosyl-ATP diphosphatase HisIE [Balneolales bacterium]